jgi:hypothetical protein
MTVGFDDKDAGLPVVPDGAQPSPEPSICRCQFRSLDGTLKNAELMAEREDLELEHRTAPKGGEKCGQKSGQEVSEGESKEKGQPSVYQSDRILREPQVKKRERLNSRFTKQIRVSENDNRPSRLQAAGETAPRDRAAGNGASFHQALPGQFRCLWRN